MPVSVHCTVPSAEATVPPKGVKATVACVEATVDCVAKCSARRSLAATTATRHEVCPDTTDQENGEHHEDFPVGRRTACSGCAGSGSPLGRCDRGHGCARLPAATIDTRARFGGASVGSGIGDDCADRRRDTDFRRPGRRHFRDARHAPSMIVAPPGREPRGQRARRRHRRAFVACRLADNPVGDRTELASSRSPTPWPSPAPARRCTRRPTPPRTPLRSPADRSGRSPTRA